MGAADPRDVGLGKVSGPVSVLLADDHRLVRQGLRERLTATGEVAVVGEAANGEEAIRLARELAPRVVLMDAHMPIIDGFRATEAVTRAGTATSVIVLAMYWDDTAAIQAVRSGARGFLLKGAAIEDVLRAIRQVVASDAAVDPILAPVLLREYRKMLGHPSATPPRQPERRRQLSPRETALLRLLASGSNNRQIATELVLAESTVKNNLSALFHKIGARDRTQAVLYAFAAGLSARPPASPPRAAPSPATSDPGRPSISRPKPAPTEGRSPSRPPPAATG